MDLVKQKIPLLLPQFNKLYDSLRSADAWRFVSDNYASGTISTSVNSTVQVTVKLANTPLWRLEQWPGAVHLYLMLRFFGIAPQSVPTANAGMECMFIDNSGGTTPLGEFLSQTGGNGLPFALLNAPITDPSNTSVGVLSVALANVASSNGTYNYSFGFSAVYVVPARDGYQIYEHIAGYHHETIDDDNC